MTISDRWREQDNRLTTTIEVADFTAAVTLLEQIAALAEEAQHHPDINIHDYNQVTISLTSHDAGKVTERDRHLATRIDEIL